MCGDKGGRGRTTFPPCQSADSASDTASSAAAPSGARATFDRPARRALAGGTGAGGWQTFLVGSDSGLDCPLEGVCGYEHERECREGRWRVR